MLPLSKIWRRSASQQRSSFDNISSCRKGSIKPLAFALTCTLFSASTLAHDNSLLPMTCYQDAMLVFDASGSMVMVAEQDESNLSSRIKKAQKALSDTLPHVAPFRRLGLITYGPGGYCRTKLDLRPEADAADKIISVVKELAPDGRTPLTNAVAQAADVLDYRNKPALIVVLTDGEESCGGDPCELARRLKSSGKAITVDVVGYRVSSANWTGGQGIAEMKCLTEETGGRYIGANSMDELKAALDNMLGCPLISSPRMPGRKFAKVKIKMAG